MFSVPGRIQLGSFELGSAESPGGGGPTPGAFTGQSAPQAQFAASGTFAGTSAPKVAYTVYSPAGPLPSAVYTSVVMATAGSSVIFATTGTEVGEYARRRTVRIAAPVKFQITTLPRGTSVLPTSAETTVTMVTAGSVLALASSGTCFGQYARLLRVVMEAFEGGSPFTATAAPQCTFRSGTAVGTFLCTAAPGHRMSPGFVLHTADPEASFTAINNAYTQFGFEAPAVPTVSYTVIQPPGFAAEAAPQLKWFPEIGQGTRCLSKPGAAVSYPPPTNFVY